MRLLRPLRCILKVPNLRFPGFDGEWETKKLHQVTAYVDYRGKAPSKTEQGHFLVTAKNIKKGFIDYETSKEYVSENDYLSVMSKGLPEIGDVLFTTEAPMGNVAQVDDKNIALAQRVIKFSGMSCIDNSYLLYYMLSDVFQKNISEKAIGTTVQGISGKELHQINISFPQTNEQTKIATFLSLIDERIQCQNKIIEGLMSFKSGLSKKILSQELRFKDDDGEDFSEWKFVQIKDIFQVTRGNVLSMLLVSKEKTDECQYPVFSSQTQNSGLAGFYNKYLFEDAITWTTDGAGAGDVNYRSGKFYCTNVCGVLISKDGYANQLVAETLNSISRKYVSYVGNPKLMNNVMAEIPIQIPSSIKEQKKISDFLSSIDEKIEIEKKILEQYKNQKAYLLQNLFI